MRIILIIAICSNFLFSVTINNKYIINKKALSSLPNSFKIYDYIKKKPKIFNALREKSFFSFSDFDIIEAKEYSSYKEFYIFKNIDNDYIYIKIPLRLMQNEFDLRVYKKMVKKKTNYYILRFKKEFTKKNLTYLNLDIGEKKEFIFTFKSNNIFEFLKKHSNLLFEKEDLIDKVSVFDEKIVFTTNYTQKDFKLNFHLKNFIDIYRRKITTRKKEENFLLKIDENLPPLECNSKNLLNSIHIDDEEFIIGEEKVTSNIYSLYLLSSEGKLDAHLKKNIKFISMSSTIKDKKTHILSYDYRTKDIKMYLSLPKNISYDIRSKFISSFNSFKIKIDGAIFDSFVDGKNLYKIPQNLCKTNNNELNVLNIENYSEYAKWNMKINQENESITWTPVFNIHKVSPIIYAPFLLKKQNKFVINSMIDEDSKMKGEVRYAYMHDNTIYQNKSIINPQTNTNLYFKYPKDAEIDDILKKTKFTYNSNPVNIASSKKNEIKFTSNMANRIALVYIPSGNIDSFRKYFLRYFECNKEEAQEEEICFNYLADMENAINVFLNTLRKSNKYSEIIYRKGTYKEQDKKNLLVLNRENRNYNQAKDDEVLGKNYDNYKWDLLSSLSNDKKALENYGLRNIDLIYFSNVDSGDTKTLSILNDYGFNKIFLINFGKKMGNVLNEYENIELVHHKYNKAMQSKIQELDASIFKTILEQITTNKRNL